VVGGRKILFYGNPLTSLSRLGYTVDGLKPLHGCLYKFPPPWRKPLRVRDGMIRELMQQIIAAWHDREPTAQYRFVPNDGWYPLGDESISYPRIPEKDLKPYAEYCLVQEETIWRLYKDSALNQHLLCRMEVDLETDTIVWSFWVLPGDELASLILDFVRIQSLNQ